MDQPFRRTYSQITLDERRKIERWHAAKISVDVIAEKLGRHRSTVFRELKRNRFDDPEMLELAGYYGPIADTKSKDRRGNRRKLVRLPQLREAIIERIRHGWSPEQVAGCLKLEGGRHGMTVCHETIYRFAYSKDGQAIKLWHHLPERRARRRPRHARRRHGRRFSPHLSILHRPDIVRERQQFGHWECDLMQFRKKFGEATSLVERVSRFTVFLRNNDRQSRPIMERLIRTLEALPATARRQSPSTVAPNSPTGPISRPDLARRPGSVIRSRPGRKALSRTPPAGPEDGFRARLTRSPSAIANCAASATSSTRRRANASASGRRPKCSGKGHGADAMNRLACRCAKVAPQRELPYREHVGESIVRFSPKQL